LRGLAALTVALSHYVLAFQPALLGGGPAVSHFDASVAIGRTGLIVLYNPELGVAIFFVLSGFVLSASMARSDLGIAGLALRRWVRLALPILGTSLLIWPLAQWRLFRSVEAGAMAKSDWLAGNYGWLAFESNDIGRLVWQSLVDIFARERHFYNTALWTMPIEFWGSLALFALWLLARLATRGRPAVAPALGLASALVLLGLVWKTSYFGFPCGVALFEARRLLPPSRRLAAVGGFALLVLGIAAGGMPYVIDLAAGGFYARVFLLLGPFIENPVLLLHRVGAVSLVAAALLFGPWQAVLRGRVCQSLGRISFMLYLVHVPIICSLIAASLLRLAPTIGYNPASALLLVVFLVVALAVATACTRLIDQPALHLSRRCGLWPGDIWTWVRRGSALKNQPDGKSGETNRKTLT
jgi:peptidoglycan/LPS O-acetylase OafA/YrhL